jgi:(2Fe-2S) ferredoxin
MSIQPFYRYHVFFCLNVREDGARCCSDFGALEAFEHMKTSIKKMGLQKKGGVRINRAGCFDRCGQGPLLVVYPEAIWYRFESLADIDEIIASHLKAGLPVKRLTVDH